MVRVRLENQRLSGSFGSVLNCQEFSTAIVSALERRLLSMKDDILLLILNFSCPELRFCLPAGDVILHPTVCASAGFFEKS
jgi:hypothetical protein